MMPPSEPSSSTWDDPAPRIRLLFDAAACIEAAGGPAGTVASLRHFASRCHLGLAVPGEYGKALTLAASALGDTEVSA